MMTLVRGNRHRLRVLRRRLERLARASRERGAALARRIPVPAAARQRLADRLVWAPGTTEVSIDKVLLGGQNGLRADEFAQAAGDLTWPSRRVGDGPHARLLRAWRAGEIRSDADIVASDYAVMARRCIGVSGTYFGAVDDEGIVALARTFVGDPAVDSSSLVPDHPARTAPGDPVRVAPIRDSDCFQLVDGHHRLASLAVAGHDLATVRVRRRPVSTPLQNVLDQMSWIGGERELYQPVAAPELARSWVTVRRCNDRLEAMSQQLDELGVQGASYLDVASCYGWFLAAMADLGHDVHGIERDPWGRAVAQAAYGLEPERIQVGDAVELLGLTAGTYDVVSCFSLLHHFALGRAGVDELGLLRLLDKVTGRVLFIDTGQAHEEWFARSLGSWDTAYVHAFLSENSTFDRVVDLGPDHDAVPPYERNYGRHLFACIRDW